MQILSQSLIGQGFGQLAIGSPKQTFDQYFDSGSQTWKTTYFFTSENEIHKGVMPHRRPLTFGAKLSVLPSVISKVWRRKVVAAFKS